MKKILLAAVLIAACDDKPNDGADSGVRPDTGGTVVVAIPNDLDFANGLLSGERYSQEINRHLFLPLLKYHEKLQLAPLLARAWFLEGDTAVVMELRNDVKWHDGVKTTAYDVEFTYRYGTDENTGYPNGDYWMGWNRAIVLDSFRIRFSVTPQPELLANLPWIPIMPRHLLEKSKPADLRKSEFNRKPVGNGALKFVEYRPNDRWVFEANRDIPNDLGVPNINRFVFRIVPDETARETEIVAGNVDLITQVRAERFGPLDRQPGLYAIEKPGRQFGFIGWNTRKPPLNDARVRRALTMGIDRAKIIQVLRGGRGQIMAGPVPPYHWSYDEKIEPLPYSPDSARALLQAAGVKLPLRIELKLPSNNPFNRDLGEMIRADLDKIGVQIVTRPTEFSTMIEDVTSPARKFEAVLMAWENDFRVVVHDNFHSKALDNPFQFAGYSNPQVDAALDAIQTTIDRDKARPHWHRLQTIIRDEQPWTYLYHYSDLYVARERVKGLDMDIRGAFVNLPKWWVAPQSD